MAKKGLDLTIAIGGAAGQGIATPGNILARILARRGLHLYAYNAYQSTFVSFGLMVAASVSQHFSGRGCSDARLACGISPACCYRDARCARRVRAAPPGFRTKAPAP